MIYSIGTNFSKKLIENIGRLDPENKIKAVFGKLPEDVIGGGRASLLLPQIDMKQLEEYINLCHDNKIKFNYLLNPLCLGNKEVDPIMHNKIMENIDSLVSIGVDGFTVNSPYLCRVIKKRYPSIKITVGLYAAISSVRQIDYWGEMGADEITLAHKINRDFKVLEGILRHTADKKISVRLIANNVCLKDCPYKVSHGSGQSHASASDSNKLYCDLDLLSCTYKKISDPVKLISSDWIRPEDVKYYTQLCKKTNNFKFSIKLVERTKDTEFLTRVAEAYINEAYDGNLLDILGWPEKKQVENINYDDVLKSIGKSGYRKEDILQYFAALNLPDMYIDNKKLDGFIEKFITDNNCDYCTCADLDSSENKKCQYCKKWAEKAISFNENERNEWTKRTNNLLNQFDSGTVYRL